MKGRPRARARPGARLRPVGGADAARAQFGLARGVGEDGAVALARRVFRYPRGDAAAHPGVGEYDALGVRERARNGRGLAQAFGDGGAGRQRPVDALLKRPVVDFLERAPGAGFLRQRINSADDFRQHDVLGADARDHRVAGNRGVLRGASGGPQRGARQGGGEGS